MATTSPANCSRDDVFDALVDKSVNLESRPIFSTVRRMMLEEDACDIVYLPRETNMSSRGIGHRENDAYVKRLEEYLNEVRGI